MYRITEQLAKQFRRPTGGFWGLLTEHFLKANRPVQECAVLALGVHPDDNVLELGFGFGHGLKYTLDNGLREGNGTLYGIDYSSRACKKVSKVLRKDVASGKLKILNEDASHMSLKDASIDRVYHTYCYHFWENQCDTCREIIRVMKPGGLMVTGLSMERLRDADVKGFVPFKLTDPEKYMKSLIASGYENVHIKDIPHKIGPKEIKMIFATKPVANTKAGR